VLVVGAGPTGLAAALALVTQGVDVAIIDEVPTAHREARASAVHARTLELLAPYGVSDRIVAYASPVHAVRFFNADGGEVMRRTPGAIDSQYPALQNVQQWRTEALLAEHLGARGIEVERGTRFVNLAEDESGVDVVLATSTGERTIRAAFVLAADGSHSAVRHVLGMHMQGSDYPERWIAGELSCAEEKVITESHILFESDRVSLQFPLDRGRLFFATLKDDELPGHSRGPVAAEEVARIYRASFGKHTHLGASLRAVPWSSLFMMHQCTVPEYRRGRIFLAGDAAHLCSAAGGNGMNAGIGDAINLAWRLAAHLRFGASSKIFDGYSLDRHEHFEHVNQSSDAAHRLIVARDPACFKLGTPRGVRAVLARVFAHAPTTPAPADRELGETSFASTRDPAYVHRLTRKDRGEIRAGMRVPPLADCSVGFGAPRPWCALYDGFHWTLLLAVASRDEIHASDIAALDSVIASRLHGRLRTVVAAGDAFRWNAPYPTVYLVRPDGVVAYCEDGPLGRVPSPEGVSNWLDSFFPAH
jgi:2-polyprenyl-6-methoxyphenol hydroxylase-like FAD-dependent oxidoreductase